MHKGGSMEGTKPGGKRGYTSEKPETPGSSKNSRGTLPDRKADDLQQSEQTGTAGETASSPVTSLGEAAGNPQSSGAPPLSAATSYDDLHPVFGSGGKGPASAGADAEKPAARAAAFSLIEMLTHSNEKLRVEAIESLLKIGDRSLSYAFASALKDHSFRVRLGALRGLYKFSGDAATEYLITALEDTHPDVRRRALIYLGWMRKRETLPFITDALSDPVSRVRKVAAYALGDIKDISAIPYLGKSLDDTDQEVIQAALAALKRITGKSSPGEHNVPGDDQHALISKWKEWCKKESS